MNKTKYHYYVLVLGNHGPSFVTKVNGINKTAEWNRKEKPLELSKYYAENLATGLMLNFNLAYMISSIIEIEHQPYNYEDGEFEWKWNKDKEEE